jgi:flavin-dependent dehydrogenase
MKFHHAFTIFILSIFILVSHMSCKNESVSIEKSKIDLNSLTSVLQNSRDLPVVDKADVVVIGGGISGVTAALRAAKDGSSVIIIESRNFFGHEITATYQCRNVPGIPSSVNPVSRSIYQELLSKKILVGDQINPKSLSPFLLNKIMEQSEIKVYLYSRASEVIFKDNQPGAVIFTGRDGRQAILAKVIIDATDNAHLTNVAGANLTRTLEGSNVARRFASIKRPENMEPGEKAVNTNLGLIDNKIMIHDGHLELSLKVNIGEDIAGDVSDIHGQLLEKCFILIDQLESEGIQLNDFTPASETWFDEMPVVSCREKFTVDEVQSLEFSRAAALQPVNVDGILIAGRTVDSRPQFSGLQVLLCTGELAGKTAARMVQKIDGFINLDSTGSDQISKSSIVVREITAGIEPGKIYPQIRQSAIELPVRGRYDVIVVGGGTSGAISAISAARHGSRVAVIEILPNLGGISTNKVNGYYWGAPWKSMLRQELGDGINLKKSMGSTALEKVSFSGEDKKYVLQDLALKAGVKIYYQSLATGTVIENNNILGVVVENLSGRHIMLADVVIDATGNASIAVAAGADFKKGRETDGFLHEIEHGPQRDPTILTDISSSYLKFPSASISMNIRESRRVMGNYVISFDDLIHEKQFPDVICRFRSNYDTHFPTSSNQSDLAQDWVAMLGQWRRPLLGSIPYASILPDGINNILVTGMAYSADHDALIAGRMQPDLEHLGEAAGVAAAMASKMKVTPQDIPIKDLQKELVHLGVLRSDDVPGRKIKGGPSIEQLHSQDYWFNERLEQFPPDAKPLTLKENISSLGTDKALDAMVQLYLAGNKSAPLLRPLLPLKENEVYNDEGVPDVTLANPPPGSNDRIYEESALLLGLLNDRSSIPALMEFLEQRNTRRFEYKIPQASSRPSLPLYWSSAILLGRFKEKEAVPLLTDLLATAPAPEQLQKFHRNAYGVDMFENTDICPPPLVSFIIVALGRIGDPSAAKAIKPFLSVTGQVNIDMENTDFETAWGIQTNAAWALAQLGDLSGVPALIKLLDSDQALVRNYARNLLESITQKKFGKDRKSWENWWTSGE